MGTNDLCEDDCAMMSIVAGNLGIVQKLRDARPDATVVVNSILPRTFQSDGKLDDLWRTIQSINQQIESYTREMENVGFFNATNLFLADAWHLDVGLLPDLVHPFAAGSRIWGQQIVRTTRQIINTQS